MLRRLVRHFTAYYLNVPASLSDANLLPHRFEGKRRKVLKTLSVDPIS